jgi:hypothetical protein
MQNSSNAPKSIFTCLSFTYVSVEWKWKKGVDMFMYVCRGGVYFTMKEHKKFVGG